MKYLIIDTSPHFHFNILNHLMSWKNRLPILKTLKNEFVLDDSFKNGSVREKAQQAKYMFLCMAWAWSLALHGPPSTTTGHRTRSSPWAMHVKPQSKTKPKMWQWVMVILGQLCKIHGHFALPGHHRSRWILGFY